MFHVFCFCKSVSENMVLKVGIFLMKIRGLVFLAFSVVVLIVSCTQQIVDTAPSVISTVPSANAKDVLVNSNITINFDESVSYDASSFKLVCASQPQAFKLVSTSPGKTVTINPDNTLFAGTCSLTIIASKISDVDDVDPPDNLNSDYILEFTTESDTAPSIVNTSPSNGATNVKVNENIIISFNEAVSFSERSFQLKCGSNTQPFKLESTSPEKTVTINPENTFPAGDCILTVVADQIFDSDAIDPPDTLVSDYTLVFSTESDTAPSVMSSLPVDGAQAVAGNDNIEITFSEVVSYTKNSAELSCDGEKKEFVLESTSPSNTLIINPNEDVLDGTCSLKILAASISDIDNIDPPDTLVEDFNLSFTTQNLYVSKIGTGQGIIFSIDNDNISCGADCSDNVLPGSTVKLQAEANTATSYFASWQGVSCKEGQNTKTCTFVTSESSTQVSALFQPLLELRVKLVDDSGNIDITGNLYDSNQYENLRDIIKCGSSYIENQDCVELLVPGDTIRLNISNSSPHNGKIFDNWSGTTCEYGQTSTTCNFVITANTTVSANFVDTHTVTVTQPIDGIIMSYSHGLYCGNTSTNNQTDCSIEVGPRETIRLETESRLGSGLLTWGNAICSDSNRSYCNFTVTEDVVLNPVFPKTSKVTINFSNRSPNAVIRDDKYKNCATYLSTCEWHYEVGSLVTLNARVDRQPQRSFFESWSGVTCDQGTQTGVECSFTATEDLDILANYNETAQLIVIVSVENAFDAKISDNYSQNCDFFYGRCVFLYNKSESVVLTASTLEGNVFESWGTSINCDEGLQNTSTCSFTIPTNVSDLQINPTFK